MRLLLAAGATLLGKTQMDEMAWALQGENEHYGTPTNPAAPGRALHSPPAPPQIDVYLSPLN